MIEKRHYDILYFTDTYTKRRKTDTSDIEIYITDSHFMSFANFQRANIAS